MTVDAITPVVMPKWGLEMREGTITEWLVEEGARIAVGMPIMEVETDKISNAVEAADAGLLRRRVAQAGETLPVKALLGVLAEPAVSDEDIDSFIASFVVPQADAGDTDDGPVYDHAMIDGIKVRFARRGPESGVPVVFLHGFGGDLGNWMFNIDAIAEDHPVIAIDLPAHGQSVARLPGASVAAFGEFVERFLANEQTGPVHLVGHSMGGAIALWLARHRRQQIASLALVSPAGFGREIDLGYIEGFIGAASRRELKPVAERLFADPSLVSRQMLDDLLRYKRIDGVSEALTELAGEMFGAANRDAASASRGPTADAAGGQRDLPGHGFDDPDLPMLVVWGREDRIVPAHHAEHAPRGAKVVIFDEVGHMAMLERAGEFNNLLREHLAG